MLCVFQGALPQIFKKTRDEFFSNILNILREAADVCYNAVKEIPCLTCPHKPEGSMTVMVHLTGSFFIHLLCVDLKEHL